MTFLQILSKFFYPAYKSLFPFSPTTTFVHNSLARWNSTQIIQQSDVIHSTNRYFNNTCVPCDRETMDRIRRAMLKCPRKIRRQNIQDCPREKPNCNCKIKSPPLPPPKPPPCCECPAPPSCCPPEPVCRQQCCTLSPVCADQCQLKPVVCCEDKCQFTPVCEQKCPPKPTCEEKCLPSTNPPCV
ncbi:DBF4-type zinc finger-containing protein 2 homolog [Chrysoperla carnea]|uniref:DBF4-type zinc finger-containing protein 2 homolog n=1 Tax=Chrysoperla carnea TaxID=189513 RepID=UPI001D09361B|nr:DBF4-type zinc finger-containing protein 2 homolog [Chrysoperla carnea]